MDPHKPEGGEWSTFIFMTFAMVPDAGRAQHIQELIHIGKE